MIVNTIKKIVDTWLGHSSQHLQGMQNIIDEAHYEYTQGQVFEQLAFEHHQAFQSNTINAVLGDDQSVHNNRNAMWNFLSAALKGHSEAQYKLGLGYLQGQLGLDKNHTHAQEWLTKAAKQGHSDAQYKLGVAYLHGQSGLDKNYTLAEEWLKEAAKQGHHEAQMTLEKAYSQLAFS
ncbi:sel1 repeat family protein [Acinetobacter sp. NIPH 2377]|uniref:tetratricopeptide repeat protein n=1 Tax=Acinetobacter terrestris TaxID=2529843 RepID=UPI00148FE353|nr:tetratricopeptide repeat protein [Acinetobacter terrestris]NNH34798.1 sel1 repeat family protein [Acinetobacter terrestris]